MSKDILYQGKVNVQTDDGVINIYDRERLLSKSSSLKYSAGYI